MAEVIRPALERGEIVICDRYSYSTLAYQGYGRGMDLSLLGTLNTLVTEGVTPDLVVFLDMDIKEGLERKGRDRDRFEREDMSFHRRVREGYLEMAAAEPGLWLVVDAALPRREIGARIWQRVQRTLEP